MTTVTGWTVLGWAAADVGGLARLTMMDPMILDDWDPAMIVLHVAVVLLGLASLLLGLRVVRSRRFPAAWIRLARLTPEQQAQPVRLGGGQALIGAALLAQQAPFVISMPAPLRMTLFAVSVALLLAAIVVSAAVRR